MGSVVSAAPEKTWAKAAEYFNAHDLDDIRATFSILTLSHRRTADPKTTNFGIDKKTFGEYFSYPGVLRDHLFDTFDTNGDGYVDAEEFLRGMAMCCRGRLDEKLRFCFNMFDLSGDGFVDRNELRQCLQSTAFASFALLRSVAEGQGTLPELTEALTPSTFNEEIDMMVTDAFQQSDMNCDGRLSYSEFEHWLLTTPEVVSILYSVFELRNHVDTEDVKREFAEGRKKRLLKRSDTNKAMVELESKREVVHRKLAEARVQHLKLQEELHQILWRTVEARRKFFEADSGEDGAPAAADGATADGARIPAASGAPPTSSAADFVRPIGSDRFTNPRKK